MPVNLPDFSFIGREPPLLGPGIESGINMMNALREAQMRQQQEQRQQQLFPEELRLAKAKADIEQEKRGLPFSGQHLGESANDLMALKLAEKQYGENSKEYKFLENSINLRNQSRQALIDLRQNPERYSTKEQKNLTAFEKRLKIDNPNWSDDEIRQYGDAYLHHKNEIDGMKLPPLSSQAENLRSSIWNSASTVAIRNQAAQMQNAYDEIKSVDIKPIQAFSGLKGTANFYYQQANPDKRTKEWYDYDTFRTVDKTYIMDTLRKAWGTSVVPEYVNTTIGKLSNPNDPIWGNPKQVEERWNRTIELTKKNAENLRRQAERGPTALKEEEPAKTTKPSNITEENIQHTMKLRNLSREEVIRQLKEKGLM